jgi:hypothetical protein
MNTMKSSKIFGLLIVIFVMALATSCSDEQSEKKSSATANSNPELWQILKSSDWAAWNVPSGVEMKFIGNNHAIYMEWAQDPATKAWTRMKSDVGTVEFDDDNWFVINFDEFSIAYLYNRSDSTFENSNGSVYRKSRINTFIPKGAR